MIVLVILLAATLRNGNETEAKPSPPDGFVLAKPETPLATESYNISDQAMPMTNDNILRQGDIFDETSPEEIDKSEHAHRAGSSRFHDESPKPEPRPLHYNSLPTGTRISEDVGIDGHGELTISNRTNVDAVVRLYETFSLQTVRWFFVKAYTQGNVGAIPEGTYTLVYTSGLDWIDSKDIFRWHPSYHEFERSLTYSEEHDRERLRYHEISVTLHPVAGGNVRTQEISREEFLKGHRHIRLQKSQSQPTL